MPLNRWQRLPTTLGKRGFVWLTGVAKSSRSDDCSDWRHTKGMKAPDTPTPAAQAMQRAILRDFAKGPRRVAFHLAELGRNIAPDYRQAIQLALKEWRR